MDQMKFLHQKKLVNQKNINKKLIQKAVDSTLNYYSTAPNQIANASDDPEKVQKILDQDFQKLVHRIKLQYQHLKHRKYNVHFYETNFHRKNRQDDKPKDNDNLVI